MEVALLTQGSLMRISGSGDKVCAPASFMFSLEKTWQLSGSFVALAAKLFHVSNA